MQESSVKPYCRNIFQSFNGSCIEVVFAVLKSKEPWTNLRLTNRIVFFICLYNNFPETMNNNEKVASNVYLLLSARPIIDFPTDAILITIPMNSSFNTETPQWTQSDSSRLVSIATGSVPCLPYCDTDSGRWCTMITVGGPPSESLLVFKSKIKQWNASGCSCKLRK